MAMIDAFAKTPIWWEVATPGGFSGDSSFGAATSLLARVQYKEIEFTSAQTGRKMLSSTQIYFNQSNDIKIGDRISIGSVSAVLIVEAMSPHNMFGVNDHKKALLV
jgi:hypothetical protein